MCFLKTTCYVVSVRFHVISYDFELCRCTNNYILKLFITNSQFVPFFKTEVFLIAVLNSKSKQLIMY